MPDHKLYSEVQLLPIDSIKPSPFENPNEFSEELYQSFKNDVQSNGLIGNPLIVNPVDNTLLDGNHRLRVLRELGYQEAPVVFFEPADELEQKMFAISLNQKRGTFNEQRLHNLIKEIYDSGRYSLEELKDKLGFNLSELKEKLSAIKVDEDLIRKVEQEAMESQMTTPVLLSFAVSPQHQETVIAALEKASGTTKGEKLHTICTSYLTGETFL